jgi:hypothetical protein
VATTPAAQNSKSMWHVSGTWSAREDRVAPTVWLGILWVGMLAGFGVDFSRYLHENPPAPTIVSVHAVVFTIWLVLLSVQVLLVLRNHLAWHRRLGWFMAGWACLMVVLGPWAFMTWAAVNLHGPNADPQFLSVNLVDIVGFLVLLGWGIALRKNPAAHRRMMVLATISLADPGFNRFSGYLLLHKYPTSVIPWFLSIFYGNVLLILLMAAWDWWRGRLMRSFVVGAATLLGAEFAAALLYFWGPWKALATAWVEAWAKLYI